MYNAFFHFREAPFSITPDPAFLYLSPRHHEALAHLLYGTGTSGGFVLLAGEVGTGKTTVVRTLLEQQLDDVDIALILNPRQSPHEFLQSLCDELGVGYAAEATSKQLVDALNRHLLAAHGRSRRTVLIIDEAQNLSEELLEQIRLLTNLETHKQKLLRIMLIGQPELLDLLARPGLRQLAQRITARFLLTALNADETAEYIAHRLRVVGGDADIFDAAARRAVYRASNGVPRLINVLCDRALLAAYSAGTRHVTAAMVREAAREVAPSHRPVWWRRLQPAWIPGVAAAGIVAAAAAWSAFIDRDARLPGPATEAAEPQSAAAPAAATDSRTGTSEDASTADHAAAPADGGARETSGEHLRTSSLRALPPGDSTPEPQAIDSAEQLLSSLPSLADQLEVLLGLWRASPELAAGENLCASLEADRLRCLRGSGGWEDLQQFDRPAILTLISARGDRSHLLLRGIDDEHAAVYWRDGIHRVARDTVDLLWNGDYFLLWRNTGPDKLLRQGASGDEVRWLHRALAEAAGEPLLGEPKARFDAELRARVESFQRRNALKADGQVGERTLLLLMHAVAPEDPTLAIADTPAAAVEAEASELLPAEDPA